MFENNLHMLNARAIISAVKMRYRVGFLVTMFITTVVGILFIEPLPQSIAYHGFVDTRAWLGIANIGNVASNVLFAIAGAYGLYFVFGPQGQCIFANSADRWPYAFFFLGAALVSFGSAYYHLAPDNARLFWDRLPMTIAFMALFSIFIADRIDQRIGVKLLLPILVMAGIISVFYWDWSETVGRGDLRFYFLVQFYPIVALPIICWLFPKGRYTSDRSLIWLIAWYAPAKVLEIFDAEVFSILGNIVSGHSLKHLASSVTIFVVIRMLADSRRSLSEVNFKFPSQQKSS
ncbi:MAG: ceramidase domain-containing protein [Rhodospirillales bacterium]|nr:ceramidase domain-containing protein [Rhodospirillales bacterium]